MILISKRELSSSKDLLFDGSIQWTNEANDYWQFGSIRAEKSAEALIESTNQDSPEIIPEEFIKSMKGIAKGKVPWPLVIPHNILIEQLEKLKAEVADAIEYLDGYENHLAENRRVISKLLPCKIDKSIYNTIINENANSVVESFKPDDDLFVDPPTYSHKTSTGRLIIKSGPKILSLNKEYRKMFTSRFNRGSVMMIDFVSLEPRILRLLAAGEANYDIYSEISKKFNGDITRGQAKLATLKLLYGSSISSISSDVGSIKRSVIKEIENFFGLSALKEKLANEFRNNKIIKSYWGRPLPDAIDDHLFVSHYTQSSAVDFALSGFNQILDKIQEEDLEVAPCYLIHDALVVDVSSTSIEALEKIVNAGVDIKGVGHFNLSFKNAYLENEE